MYSMHAYNNINLHGRLPAVYAQSYCMTYSETSLLRTLNRGHLSNEDTLLSQLHRTAYRTTSKLGTPLHTDRQLGLSGVHYREVPLYNNEVWWSAKLKVTTKATKTAGEVHVEHSLFLPLCPIQMHISMSPAAALPFLLWKLWQEHGSFQWLPLYCVWSQNGRCSNQQQWGVYLCEPLQPSHPVSRPWHSERLQHCCGLLF